MQPIKVSKQKVRLKKQNKMQKSESEQAAVTQTNNQDKEMG